MAAVQAAAAQRGWTELAMKQIEVILQNRTGLHARPAKVLVNLAKQFQSDINLQQGAKRANAKSMVSVLTLGAVSGSGITVQATGVDEDQAIAEIEAAIHLGLGDNDGPVEPAAAPAPAATAAPVTVQPSNGPREPNVIKGVGAAPGIAVGPIFHFQRAEFDLEPPAAASADGHLDLAEALARARSQLTVLHQQMTDKRLGAEAAIFEAHMEMLDDPELAAAVRARVTLGQSQAKAWKATIDERAAGIAALDDPLLAARADDLRDVGRRVLGLMLGDGKPGLAMPATPAVV